MARPQKEGFDYFPLDTDFLQNDKIRLLKAEFGPNAIVVLLNIWSKIYKENGYYLKWDDDSCFLMSEGMGSVFDHKYISEVVAGCLRRFLFDEEVFKTFRVLTSKGIQRTVMRMIDNRSQYRVISEYWLLDVDDEKDVPPKVLDKLIFRSVSRNENPVLRNENRVKRTENPQSKVNKNKVNKSSSNQPPTLKEIKDFIAKRNLKVNADLFFTYYKNLGWKTKDGTKITDWKSLLIRWSENENEHKQNSSDHIAAYDLDLFEKMIREKD